MIQLNNSHLYYLENEKYSKFLDNQSLASFRKYISVVQDRIHSDQTYLDVGCGSGIVLQNLKEKGYAKGVGIEISNSSIKLAQEKGLECYHYDGLAFPFKPETFDLVGSINVLEHTQNPIAFLDEKYRVLKNNGIFLLVCPNFLSVTNNYHKNTQGHINKLRNLLSIIDALRSSSVTFNKMEMTIRDAFQPDDDAVNVTNPIMIEKWARYRNLHTTYSSAFQTEKSGLLDVIDKTPLRILFGSCFYIFRK